MILPLLLLCHLVSAQHDWEWAGVFHLHPKAYTWSASRVDGNYADASMRAVIVKVKNASEEALVEVVGDVNKAFSHVTDNVTSGSEVSLVGSQLKASRWVFDNSTWVSVYYVKPDDDGDYAFFLEHHPVEFEDAFHYLKDESGADIEPGWVHSDGDEVEKQGSLAFAVGGAFLTTLPAILLMAIVGPAVISGGAAMVSRFIPFASGAIAGTAVFLLLPEAMHLTNDALSWGFSVALGWLASLAIHHISEILTGHDHEDSSAEPNVESGSSSSPALQPLAVEGEGSEEVTKRVNWSIAVPIIAGDAAHGIVDGIAVGFAVKACDASLAWGVILAGIGHETPQELSDLVVLMSKAGMSWKQAFIINSLSAQTAVIGAIVAYETDVAAHTQGVVLALCSGVFLFIALSELYPSMSLGKQQGWLDSLIVMVGFLIGVGLMSLFAEHAHCDSGGGHGGHGGHDDH